MTYAANCFKLSGRIIKTHQMRQLQVKAATPYTLNIISFDLSIPNSMTGKTDIFTIEHAFASVERAQIISEKISKAVFATVEGELNVSSYTNQQTGKQSTFLKLKCKDIHLAQVAETIYLQPQGGYTPPPQNNQTLTGDYQAPQPQYG